MPLSWVSPSHPQQTSYVQDVSTLCSKALWTWSETDSAQYVKRKSCNFLGRSEQGFFPEICDYGWDLGPSLPIRDEATIEAVETSMFSKEAKTEMSAGKVMASIFWDPEGMLLVDYQDKAHTITGAYYADLLTASRFGVESWQVECSSTRTMHQLTCPQWQWLLSTNVDSNFSKTHPIFLIWLPLTTISSWKWKRSLAVIILPEMMMLWMLWTTYWGTKMALLHRRDLPASWRLNIVC